MSYIHENLTPKIKELYEVRVVTDGNENPLIKVGYDLHDDLHYFNDLYQIERNVNKVKGLCVALSKKSIEIADADQYTHVLISGAENVTNTMISDEVI
jgi:hypothetical protein